MTFPNIKVQQVMLPICHSLFSNQKWNLKSKNTFRYRQRKISYLKNYDSKRNREKALNVEEFMSNCNDFIGSNITFDNRLLIMEKLKANYN